MSASRESCESREDVSDLHENVRGPLHENVRDPLRGNVRGPLHRENVHDLVCVC